MKHFAKAALLFLGCTLTLSANQVFELTGTLSGSANFTFSNGSFTLTLTNTTPTLNAGNLLTDALFRLNTTGTVTYAGATGSLVTIDDAGHVIPTAGPGNWGFGQFTNSQFAGEYNVCTICLGGVNAPFNPADGILGPGTGTGTTPYSTANGSIAGNGPHNPFFNQSVTFSFTGASITTATLASDVFLSFTTTPGDEHSVTQTCTDCSPGGHSGGGNTPEPLTLVLTGSALIGLAVSVKRRRAV